MAPAWRQQKGGSSHLKNHQLHFPVGQNKHGPNGTFHRGSTWDMQVWPPLGMAQGSFLSPPLSAFQGSTRSKESSSPDTPALGPDTSSCFSYSRKQAKNRSFFPLPGRLQPHEEHPTRSGSLIQGSHSFPAHPGSPPAPGKVVPALPGSGQADKVTRTLFHPSSNTPGHVPGTAAQAEPAWGAGKGTWGTTAPGFHPHREKS